MVWFNHLRTHGPKMLGYHELLNDIYHKLIEYIDEYCELTESNFNSINIEPKELTSEELINELDSLKGSLIEFNSNPTLSDWSGRFINDITKWIYKLRKMDSSQKLFSDIKERIFSDNTPENIKESFSKLESYINK